MTFLWRIWKSRWGLARLVLASFILAVLVADTGARLARLELASLPDTDFVSQVRALREQEKLGEAVLIADQGLELTTGDTHAALERERALALEAQQSWTRRATDVLRGITLGAGPDASLERLIGAVGADFFIVGDVRDLAIQAWHYLRQGEADGVIVALSMVGIATTLAPEIEWAPNVLKAARRAGALSRRFGEIIVDGVKARNVKLIRSVVGDTAAIARRASPGVAARLLRLADEPKDLARVARFVEHEGKAGAFALNATGRAGADVLRSADELRSAGRVAEAARAERAVIDAARKGEAGAAWLKRGSYRALLRPHPIVGAAKALWSGHAAALIQRAFERLDPAAVWAIPLIAAWVAFELGLIFRRFAPRPESRPVPRTA